MKAATAWLGAGMLLWTAAQRPASAAVPGERGFSSVARSAIPGVVFIQVEKTLEQGRRSVPYNDPFDFFGDDFLRRFFGPQFQRPQAPPRRFRQTGQGSGFIVTEDGYILTNNHVVGDVDRITVRLHDGREFEAQLIGADPHSEVAVIKIEGSSLPVIPLGDSEDIEIGEWVIAVGNPFGLSATLTVGVVSATGRTNIGIADYEYFIQTDAAINPGNSGGPLLNVRGEAVGINTAIFSRSGGYMGIGFAIPIGMAREIMDQLVEKGRVERGFIGISIQEIDAELAQFFGIEDRKGILIAAVSEGSAGEQAGLQPRDVILEIDGRSVGSVGGFRTRVAGLAPGTEIRLTILREGETLAVPVRVGALDDAVAAVGSASDVLQRLGLEVQDVTPELARRFGYRPGAGVLITRVEADRPAGRAGLQPGLLISGVNRRDIDGIDAFEEILRESAKNKTILLLVTDGRMARFVAIALE